MTVFETVLRKTPERERKNSTKDISTILRGQASGAATIQFMCLLQDSRLIYSKEGRNQEAQLRGLDVTDETLRKLIEVRDIFYAGVKGPDSRNV